MFWGREAREIRTVARKRVSGDGNQRKFVTEPRNRRVESSSGDDEG